MSMYVLTYKVNGAPTAAYINTRSEANAAYLALNANPAVTNLNATIRTVTVDFGYGSTSRRYTYLATERYESGEMILVPTPYGDKLARVCYSELKTKKELIAQAKACGFSFTDYKVAIGYKR